MKLLKPDERTGRKGDTFTGDVTLESVLSAQREHGMSVSVVHFTDGARTNWHEHPGEQVLYILEGAGRVGTEDEQFLVQPGDVVHAAPGERHWHGAAPGQTMTHLSVTNRGAPEWFETPAEG